MGEKKRGLVIKKTDVKALKEAKLLDSTINFLSGTKERKDIKINDDIPLHDAVVKMKNTNFKDLDPRKTDERWVKIEEARACKEVNVNSLEKWEESKKTYVNRHKLASEQENEIQRQKIIKTRQKMLNTYKNLDQLNQKAKEVYKDISSKNILNIIKNN